MPRVLVSPAELSEHLDDRSWLVVDCRFRLDAPEAGYEAYTESHIAGAAYAHLDRDLSGPIVPGRTGRHPLPDPLNAAARLGALGIDGTVRVVAYDDAGGGLAAARLWWMLRWLGHDKAAVLDGGWRGWLAHGSAVRSGEEQCEARTFTPSVRDELVVTADDVERLRADPAWRILDARSAERFRGENETIDPVAGRIPGAWSAPYSGNLAADGTVLAPRMLRERFAPMVADVSPDRIVCYCGSGVTAALDILALEQAGISGARLYAGSWSDWILDPRRPIAAG